MLFLSRQGKIELAGGSLAMGFANITANSILKGLTMGMDPICCQAYGAKRWSLVSLTFYRTICLLLVVSIPISLLWFNMSPILQWLGQDKEVTKIAQIYMMFSIPELLAQAHLHPLRTFLRTQGLTTPLTIAASCAAILHLPINYILATHFKMGVKGVAIATGLNSINMILGLIVYIFLSDKPLKPWEDASIFQAFKGWGPLVSLALPSCASICLEWWYYEIMLFLCGLLHNPQTTVATMGILIQTTGFLYCFPYALSAALTTRVGQALGAGQPLKAQCTAIVGLGMALILGIVACFVLISLRKAWARMFTDETQIVEMVTLVLPILGLCEIGNWPQTASCGILSGSARPKLGARINLYSFYLIGLPVAIFATFVYKFEMVGLWCGMLAAQSSCFVMMAYTLCRTDWGHQSKRAEELAQVTKTQDDEMKENNHVHVDEEIGMLNNSDDDL